MDKSQIDFSKMLAEHNASQDFSVPVSQLVDMQLALVGGGIGDTVL